MSCDHIRSTFLDRDWSRAMLQEAAAVAEHLQQCPACREAVAQYEELRGLLQFSEPAESSYAGVKGDSPIFAETKIGTVPAKIGTVPHKPQPRRATQWAGAAVLAASLMVGVAGWTLYFCSSEGIGATPQPLAQAIPASAPVARWTQADVDRDVGVFTNVSETFDGRTSWVALGDHATELGLMPLPSHRQGKILLLRLVVLHDNQEKSRTDLVIVPGESANLCVPLDGDRVLHYTIGTTAGKEQRLSFWAEVRTPGCDGETLAAVAAQLKPVSGRMLGAGRLVTPSGSFNVEIVSHEQDLAKL